MHRFKNLKVWQRAMDMAETIYKISAAFPKDELYGLTSQIRRSAVSIASNIAEGAGRNSNPDFIRFLNIANGSINELETQLLISQRLKFITEPQTEALLGQIKEVQKMNYALTQKLIKERI